MSVVFWDFANKLSGRKHRKMKVSIVSGSIIEFLFYLGNSTNKIFVGYLLAVISRKTVMIFNTILNTLFNRKYYP